MKTAAIANQKGGTDKTTMSAPAQARVRTFPGKLLDQPPEMQEVNVKIRAIDSWVDRIIGRIDTR
jgi:hypothetical protein